MLLPDLDRILPLMATRCQETFEIQNIVTQQGFYILGAWPQSTG
jgi:hypothetical protein